MINFIKKYWFLALLGFIATVLAVINFFLPEKPPVQTTQAPTESFKGIVPGQTKQEQLYGLLGAPDPKQSDFSTGLLSYPREGGGPNHEVIVDPNQTVAFYIQRALSGNKADYVQKHGEPEGEFYGPEKEAGYKVYVWATKGFAVVANENSGLVFEVWYFPTTSLENFLKTWGKDLSTEFSTEGP